MRPYLYLSIALLMLVTLGGCDNPASVPAPSSDATPSQVVASTVTLPAPSSDATPSQAAAPTGEIVFTRMTIDMVNTELFIMNADGTNQQQITNSPDMEFFPTWSPDGSLIAFNYVGERDESTSSPVVQVYTMRPDGSERLQRTGTISPTMNDMYPEWSPDGSRIAYSTIAYTGIWTIDLRGSAPQRMESDDPMSGYGYTGPLAWSPDGTSFLIQVQGIQQIKTDGTLIKRLTERELDHDAAWSPDGTQIAFVRHSRDSVSAPADIFVMNADGSNLRQLTTTPAIDRTPRWSPDGKQIVFSSPGVQPTPPTPTAQPTLTPTLPDTNGYPMPSPVEYAPLQNAPEDIFVINVDGSGLTNLTNSPDHEEGPDWKP